jgi:hypothetical protein
MRCCFRSLRVTHDPETTRSLYLAVEFASILHNKIFSPVLQPCFFWFHTVNTTILLYILLPNGMATSIWITALMIPGTVFVVVLAIYCFLQLSQVAISSENIMREMHSMTVDWRSIMLLVKSANKHRWIKSNFRPLGIRVGGFGFWKPVAVIIWIKASLFLLLWVKCVSKPEQSSSTSLFLSK